MRWIIDEEEFQQAFQLLAGEVGSHQRTAGRHVHDAGTEGRYRKHVVNGLHSRLPASEPGAHHAVGSDCDVGLRGIPEGVGNESSVLRRSVTISLAVPTKSENVTAPAPVV